MWTIPQRDAAFRALDRLPVLAKANEVAPSPTPLPPGKPLVTQGDVGLAALSGNSR